MAVKERRNKSAKPYYEVKVEDAELNEALDSRKEHYEYKNGRVIVPGSDNAAKISEIPKTVSYEEVQRVTEELPESFSEQAMKEQRQKARAKNRKYTAKRAFEASVFICLVLMVGFFVLLLLYPQTELAELSRDNSNTKDRISVLKNEIIDAEEAANGLTDMDAIRAQALGLGMQDPNQNQVVNLPIPSNDNLTTAVSYDAYGISKEALDNAMGSLEEYYQNHKDQ